MVECNRCGARLSKRARRCSRCGADNVRFEPRPKDAERTLIEARKCLIRGERKRACELLADVLRKDPEDYELYFALTSCLFQQDRIGAAIAVMKAASHLDPGSAVIRYNLGSLHQTIGLRRSAWNYFNEALALAESDDKLSQREDFIHNVLNRLEELVD